MGEFVGKSGINASFPEERLKKAVDFAQQHGLFQRLQDLYATIPEGQCAGCATCCQESVETHGVEFLQIYDYLHQRPELFKELLPVILRFYLLEGAEKRYCPMQLEGKRCAIYPVRPLPCRLFGQWGREDYEANFAVTRQRNQETAEYYAREYGLNLPDQIVNPVVPYCEAFQKPQDLTQDEFYDLLDGLIAIQSRFLLADEQLLSEEVLTMGLVSWLMGTLVDLDQVHPEKIEIMREYLQAGKQGRLEGMIAQMISRL